MSDRPEGVLVRMLRWVDSGVGRLLERTGRTEQQVDKTQLAIGRIIEQLNRIEKRLEDIERRLPPRAAIEFFRRLSRRLIVTGFVVTPMRCRFARGMICEEVTALS